jgi:hypothetical protein
MESLSKVLRYNYDIPGWQVCRFVIPTGKVKNLPETYLAMSAP